MLISINVNVYLILNGNLPENRRATNEKKCSENPIIILQISLINDLNMDQMVSGLSNLWR